MPCDRCTAFDAEVEIRLPSDLARILEKLKNAVAAGLLRCGVAESRALPAYQPDFAALEPEGPWPDAMDYCFECPVCGCVFQLTAETYHGSGGKWKRLR